MACIKLISLLGLNVTEIRRQGNQVEIFAVSEGGAAKCPDVGQVSHDYIATANQWRYLIADDSGHTTSTVIRLNSGRVDDWAKR
jgi:hypothetical protein